MSATVARTAEELARRKDHLLAEVRMTQDELYERADAWTLSERERNIYETIRSINYLLGDD